MAPMIISATTSKMELLCYPALNPLSYVPNYRNYHISELLQYITSSVPSLSHENLSLGLIMALARLLEDKEGAE